MSYRVRILSLPEPAPTPSPEGKEGEVIATRLIDGEESWLVAVEGEQLWISPRHLEPLQKDPL